MSALTDKQAVATAAAAAEDDESEDDDYVPDAEEMDEDDEGDVSGNAEISGPHLSASKRKAVDEAFEKLFGYPFGTTFQPKRRRTAASSVSKRESILSDIFGPSVAAHLMATSSSVRAYEAKHVSLPLTVEQTITEVKRFAGRNITMSKKITVNATEAAAAKNTGKAKVEDSAKPPPTLAGKQPPAAGGLDSVLAEIAGPSKLSTVAKTSADWDSYKTKTGVEEELEKQAQSNKAYLVKQDFLKRVDERRFEHERAQRDKERAARNK